jgi:hypothetical protein
MVRGKCPQSYAVEAILAWVRLAGITHGLVFRAISPYGCVAPNRLTTRAVTDIVKTRFCRAGFDVLPGLKAEDSAGRVSRRALRFLLHRRL